MIGKIVGTGSFAPAQIWDNHKLEEFVETSDAWIQERTGVARRHIIKDETTVSMAAEAARRAMENGNITPEEIDMILVSTISANVILPCAACEVQKEIGAVNAACFDLNAACTGFLFAYETAQGYIHMGLAQTVLVIGAESLSNLVDWQDRGTCILFGDGAGAAIVRACEGESLKAVMHSDGEKGAALTCANMHGERGRGPIEKEYMFMDGQAVFKFAVKKVPEVINELVEKYQINIEEIDAFILHQANKRIVESVAKRLKTDISKFPMNLQEYGNTSSASIGILLDELNREGRLKPGMKLIMAGFGAGLSWGACYLEW